jgi:hypothetical protein
MNLEDAFIRGFVKAAGTGMLSSVPKAVPAMQSPPVTPSNTNPSTKWLESGSHTNYAIHGIPDGFKKFDNDLPNTVNIDMHGGGTPQVQTTGNSQKGFNSINEFMQRYPIRYTMHPDHQLQNTNFPNELTEEGIARRIGSHTNDIYNFRNTACNAGFLDCRTNINPNQIVPGYETPAHLKTIYPSLTNAIIQPPGTYGPLMRKLNLPKELQELQDTHKWVERENAWDWEHGGNKDPNKSILSVPHQYALENGTNWVDKGEYTNY